MCLEQEIKVFLLFGNFQYNILFENVGQYNSQKNYEWQFLRKWFEPVGIWTPPKVAHSSNPMTPSCLADRRHLVGLILRDVDIFMIQIKGKRCGNFRVIERLFLRRAPLNEHYTHLLLLYWLLFRRKQHDNFRSVFKGVIYNVLYFKVNIIALFWLG